MYLLKRTTGRGGYVLPDGQGYTPDVRAARTFEKWRHARKAARHGEAIVTVRSQLTLTA